MLATEHEQANNHEGIAVGLDPEIKESLETLYPLPELPSQAQQILTLRQRGAQASDDLVALVHDDRDLGLKLIRAANAYTGGSAATVKSYRQAVEETLGFDLAVNIALGFSAGRSFELPESGPLGSQAFWRHAIYTATLTHALGDQMPEAQRPHGGCAYLAGFIHDFGFLVLGHLFRPEFYLLNKLRAARPQTPITVLERQVLGMGQARHYVELGHGQLGAWLMTSWGMPDEIIPTLSEHHNPDYAGPHATYPNLIYLADTLLELPDEGSQRADALEPRLLEGLGLEAASAVVLRDQVMASCKTLDAVADELVA